MPYVEAPGRRLYAETFGNTDDPGLLLINGLTSQLTLWPVELCEAFVDRGFFVIRFDNRDCGYSTVFGDGDSYTLSDMADDAAQLIEHFGIAPAHVLGMSMGGMIAQVLAAERPDIVATMTSLASTTGNPDVGQPSPEAIAALLVTPATTREEAERIGVAGKRVWGTKDTWDESEWARFSGDNWERSHPDGGGLRQYSAIHLSGNRDEQLKTITVPSLVIHGSEDWLIDVSGGRRTAELIEHCDYLEIEGMGHDLPMVEWPQIVQAVTSLAARAYEN